jgi:hypothetical protein
MNPNTFCKNVERITTGSGFKRVIQGLDLNDLRLASGAPLAADSGNPMRASLETYFEGVQLASSQTALGVLSFQVPRDYDESVDKMYVRFLANSAGTTDAPTIDASLYQKKLGTALSSDLDPTISAAVAKTSATTGNGWVEVKAESQGLVAGAGLTWIFASSAHTTDALNIYALEVVYYSDLAYFDASMR